MTDLTRLAMGTVERPELAPAPVRLAADELAGYLARMFGSRPQIRGRRGAAGAWLHVMARGARPPDRPPMVPAGAEYSVEPREDVLALAGATPRALLAATYALLEAAGCRWSPAGGVEEHVPLPGAAERAAPALVCRPAFARRAYASDLSTWHYSMPARLAERLPADVAFIDWMAKSGATAFQFIRHANDTQWVIPELLPELARRGLAVEAGGHALPELLPRDLHARHPDYFPAQADGTRSDFGNVCGASSGALSVVRARTRAVLKSLGRVSDFHLWGLDLFGGGWCACTACQGLTPSDQSLRLCNAAAEGLDEGRVLHLAYHDTLAPPRTLRPHPAVWAEFAPRERCYGHALDDPACATNPPYREALERHVELFAGRVEVFEYYGDAILFGGCAVPLTRVIAGDLEYYRRAGVRGVSCLVFGAYSLLAHGVNLEAFARGAVEPRAVATARAHHCARAYGAAGAMAHYLAALETLMASVVTYGDVKLPPRRGARATAALAALDAALDGVPAVRHLLEAGAAGVAPREAAERQLFEYTVATLAATRLWLASALAGSASAADQALTAMGDAVARMRAVDPRLAGTWGTHDLEVTHAFFAGALRAPADFRES